MALFLCSHYFVADFNLIERFYGRLCPSILYGAYLMSFDGMCDNSFFFSAGSNLLHTKTKQSRFGHGDITGKSGLDFWSDLKKVTTTWPGLQAGAAHQLLLHTT